MSQQISVNSGVPHSPQLLKDILNGLTEAELRSLHKYYRKVPTPKKIILREMWNWRPQSRQATFLDAAGVLDWFLNDGPIREPKAKLIGYGGAAGGGKTDTFLALALIICYAFPGAQVSFFRRKYTELEGADGAIFRSQELFSSLGKYNETKHRWEFDLGGNKTSNIYFRHCHHEKNRYDYQGQGFHVLLIDEATHFTWPIIDYLITRNRTTVQGLIPFTCMASNPGNVGHVWMSTMFDVQDLSGGEEGPHEQVKHRLTQNEKYADVYFVPAKLEDNQVLMQIDPDYELKLEARDPDLVEALRWGNWMVFAGQAFRSWRREKHVIDPAQIPEHWPKWRAVDWGKHAPFCCLWFTRNPDSGRIYVYRELYRKELTDRQQARLIRELTPPEEQIYLTYADPSMWIKKSKDDLVYCSADEYAGEGVPLTRANNDRIDGKRKVDRLLQDLPDGRPGIQIFRTCLNLIRTLPMLSYDETRIEDVDTEQEDHAYDALKYGLSNYKVYPYGDRKEDDEHYQSPLAALGSNL